MTELATRYMGLELRNPLVASPSPLSHTVDGILRLADSGIGSVVLHSLFEEELRQQAITDAYLANAGSESFAESLSYFPPSSSVDTGAAHYLSVLERAASAVDVPLIASLNGVSPGGWTRFARQMSDAGASAIELNVHVVQGDVGASGRGIEQLHLDVLRSVKDAVDVPVALKLSPYFSSIGEIALRLDEAGADALVLFNRPVLPDIDPETLSVFMRTTLSRPLDAGLARTWIALLRAQLRCSLAGTTGVEDTGDVVKYLLAGADVVMTTSALLRHGPAHAGVILDGLTTWMQRKGFHSVDRVRGLLVPSADNLDPQQPAAHDAWERSGYVRAMIEANSRPYGPW